MNNNQILGCALLAAAAVLLYFGYQGSQSLADQVSETLTGRFTDSTTWYFVLGAVAAVAGVLVIRR